MTQLPEHEISTGARPTGATSEQEAAANVQQMFDTIAPTYDRANHTLSAGLDRLMWSRAASTFRATLQRPEAVALDLCCGTGDLTLALLKHRPKSPLVPTRQSSGAPPFPASSERVGCSPSPTPKPGCPILSAPDRAMGGEAQSTPGKPAPILAADFSHQMLSRGAEKFRGHNIIPIEADALHLPIASNSIDLVTFGFGFRNLSNYEHGLAEIHRILRPGGQFGILECNQPEGIIGAIYNLYFKSILPKVGGLISGQPGAYTYLPDSVEKFPRPPRMLQLIRNANFSNASWTSYIFGTAGLYRATKP